MQFSRVCAAAVCVAAVGAFAFADSTTDSEPDLRGDSVRTYTVSAAPDEQNVYSVPAAVTVITADDIAASGKTSVMEVLATVPGVTFTEGYYGKSTASIRMRGASGDNPFGQVVVLVDGKRQNNPDMSPQNWSAVPLSAVERIEVIDGAAGARYGSGAVGGVVNIVTKKPETGVTGDASVSYGSNNETTLQASGGFGSEKGGVRAFVDYYRSSGWREHSALSSLNAGLNGYVSAAGKLTFRPSASYFTTDFELPGSLTEAEFNADPTQANAASVASKDKGSEWNAGAALTGEFVPGDKLTVSLPVAWTYKNRQFDNYGYTTYFFHQIEAAAQAVYTDLFLAGSLAARAGFDFSGVLYTGQKYGESARKTLTNEYEINQFSYAPYASASFSFTVPVVLNAGVRFTAANISAEKKSASFSADDTYYAWAYDIAASYNFTETASVYAKYGTMFRLPFIDEKTSLAFGAGFNADLKPENGWNAEAGAKYAFGDKIETAAVAYVTYLENEISYNAATYRNENLDATRRIGGSLSVKSSPVSWFSLNGNVGYVYAVFAAGAAENNRIPLQAAVNAYCQAAFNLPQGIVASSDVSVIGSRYMSGDTANEYAKLDPYALVGLSLRYTPPQLDNMLTVSASVENLFNVKYATFATAPSAWSGAAYYPGTGRTFSIRASFRY